MFESSENTTVSCVISCAAVSVSDVMNKVGMCGKITLPTESEANLLLLFIGRERAQIRSEKGYKAGICRKSNKRVTSQLPFSAFRC